MYKNLRGYKNQHWISDRTGGIALVDELKGSLNAQFVKQQLKKNV